MRRHDAVLRFYRFPGIHPLFAGVLLPNEASAVVYLNVPATVEVGPL